MADPVSKLRLLQQLKLAEMLKQVSAKFLLLLYTSASANDRLCVFFVFVVFGVSTASRERSVSVFGARVRGG